MTDDSERQQDKRRPLTRRRALQLAAGGTLVAFPGCTGMLDPENGNGGNAGNGGNGSGSNQGGGSGGSQTVDATYVTYMATKPSDLQFNPYSTADTEWDINSAAHHWMLERTRDGKTVFGLHAKDWTVDEGKVTVELADTFTWQDGKPVTAKDWQFKYDFQRYMAAGDKNALSDLVDGVQATGKHTLEYSLTQKVNEDVAVEFLRDFLDIHPGTFRKFMEKFQDAPSEKARSKVITEVSEFRWEEPIYAGPLKWAGENAQEVDFEVFDDYPFEDVQERVSKDAGTDVTNWGRPNFNNVKFLWASDDNNVNQLMNSGRVDGGRGTSLLDQANPPIPDKYDPLHTPSGYGWGLVFNFWGQGQTTGLADFRDVNVRRAFAHAINRNAVGKQLQSSPNPTLDPIITGMTETQEREWLDDTVTGKMTKHDHNPQKAARLLRRSDYTKRGGTWHKPNGDPFSVTLKTASGTNNYVSALQVATANLKSFGIDAQLVTEDDTSFFAAEPPDQGYQMTVGFYGGAWPFPYFAYDFTYNRPSYEPPGGGETDYLLPGNSKAKEVMTVPPVGKPNSDQRIEVNPHENMTALAKTQNETEQTKLVTELAWATNQWVPKLTCVEAELPELINRGDWNYPKSNNTLMTAYPSRSFIWQLGLVDAQS